MKNTCFCCHREKENMTSIDGRYVCNDCNHIKENKEKEKK